MKKRKKTILIFMGPPGSGKGTQTDILAKHLKIPAISVGELLRLEVKRRTKVGREVKTKMESGLMLPDKLIRKLMEKRLLLPDTKKGFILDGYPRRYRQIRDLEGLIKEFPGAEKNLLVFYIYISDAELKKRLSRRRVCYFCGRTYHLDINPPAKPGICDNCGHKIERRRDDDPAAITRRLRIFHRDSDPMIDYFSARNNLFRINGLQKISQVQKDILNDLKKASR